MTISMFQASVPRFVHMLNNLSTLLDKAQAHAELKKLAADALTGFRLYPDMLPFTRQVQIACDSAKGAAARLAGVDIPKHEDTEKTLEELKARIAKTVAFLESIKPAQVDGTEDKSILLKVGGVEIPFTGLGYLLDFATPNFYFHVTTAYAMLRHNGIEVGKRDYLGMKP